MTIVVGIISTAVDETVAGPTVDQRTNIHVPAVIDLRGFYLTMDVATAQRREHGRSR